MKKNYLSVIIVMFLLCISIFVSAQNTNTKFSQKPSKEDFYHTWTSERIEGKTKTTIEITFNESAYIHTTTLSRKKTIQNFTILNWEEVVNTYDNSEEYPYGFKISSKETKNGSVSNFAMFINADKTSFLSVIDLGFFIQYNIYTKK